MKILKDFFNKKKRQWDSFEKRLAKNELIKIEETDRIVATDILIQRAVYNHIPIVVGSQERMDLIKWQNKFVAIYPFAEGFTKKLFEADLPNGVLIDESVSSDLIDYIIRQGIQIRGGFELKGE